MTSRLEFLKGHCALGGLCILSTFRFALHLCSSTLCKYSTNILFVSHALLKVFWCSLLVIAVLAR